MASSADDPLVDALINNDLKFSSIYDRIFNKYFRTYEPWEEGGEEVLIVLDEDEEEQEEEEEEEDVIDLTVPSECGDSDCALSEEWEEEEELNVQEQKMINIKRERTEDEVDNENQIKETVHYFPLVPVKDACTKSNDLGERGNTDATVKMKSSRLNPIVLVTPIKVERKRLSSKGGWNGREESKSQKRGREETSENPKKNCCILSELFIRDDDTTHT